MAVLSRIKCEHCGETADFMHAPMDLPKVCDSCRAKELGSKRDQHFEGLDALSMEERLRRVEAWIYDYRPQWAPPPRF